MSNYTKLLSLGVSDGTPESVKYKIRVINGLSLLGVAIFAAFAVIDTLRSSWIEVMIDFCSIPPMSLPLLFNYFGKLSWARFGFVVVVNSIYIFTLYAMGSIQPILSLFPMVIAAICAVFDAKTEKKALAIAIGIAFMVLVLGLYLPKKGAVIDVRQDEALPYFILFFNTLGIAWMMIFFNVHLSRFMDQLARKFKERELELNSISQVGKFAALGQLAGGIAHEINNPLAIIRGKLQILISELAKKEIPKEELSTQLESLIKSTARISRITQSMLTLARADRSQMSLFATREIFTDALALVQESFAKHGITLDFELAPEVAAQSIEGTLGPLQQVLMNLLSNARDAILESGTKEDLWIRIRANVDGRNLKIQVADSGPGVPDMIAERIMEPFFTTKEVGKGTGLGLSLSKTIMETFGGRLELISRRKPTVFEMSIPCVQDKLKKAS